MASRGTADPVKTRVAVSALADWLRDAAHPAPDRNVLAEAVRLTARTLAEPLLGHGLGRALISRATRAALAESRLPLASHPASDTAARHIAQALGYRLYGQAIVYTGAA